MNGAAHGNEIGIYLKDHYAGGIGALQLIEHSIETHAGTPWATFFAELHGDIKVDHEQLHNLMTALGVADSDVRNASAGCLVGRTKAGHREFMAVVKEDARFQVSRGYRFMTAVLPAADV